MSFKDLVRFEQMRSCIKFHHKFRLLTVLASRLVK